jgi:hypothetical protein
MSDIVKDFIQGVVLGGFLMLGYILLTNYLGV